MDFSVAAEEWSSRVVKTHFADGLNATSQEWNGSQSDDTQNLYINFWWTLPYLTRGQLWRQKHSLR